MTLEEAYFASQTIAAVAIVASLIYVALQVRQTERNQRALMHQARTDRVTNASVGFSQPDMADLISKASLGSTDLSPREVVQLFYFLRTYLVALDDALWQFDSGLLDEASLENVKLTTKRLLANPTHRATWELFRPGLAPSFVERVERLVVSDVPLAQPLDWAAAWKTAYAKVTSEAAA